MKVKTYLDDVPAIIKENHDYNDKQYKPLPLVLGIIISAKLQDQELSTLLNIAQQTIKSSNTNLFMLNKASLPESLTNITLKKAMPFWAKQLSKLSILKNPSFAAIDLKQMGNFIISVGTGENLYITPHFTTFHIAILTPKTNFNRIANYALIRPEIVIVIKDRSLYNKVANNRKMSLGKPTILINDYSELVNPLKRALSIYNKMPFRWVKDLAQF